MDLLKKIFPFSFDTADVAALVIRVIIYVVGGVVAGALIGVLMFVPALNIIVGIVCSLIDIYVTAGIVITFLAHFNVLK